MVSLLQPLTFSPGSSLAEYNQSPRARPLIDLPLSDLSGKNIDEEVWRVDLGANTTLGSMV